MSMFGYKRTAKITKSQTGHTYTPSYFVKFKGEKKGRQVFIDHEQYSTPQAARQAAKRHFQFARQQNPNAKIIERSFHVVAQKSSIFD